jgi:chemotaxis protein CheY-P-specific phosphatase CheC
MLEVYCTMNTAQKRPEQDITQEVIQIGLAKAADTLSFFVKEKVLLQLNEVKVNDGSATWPSPKMGTAQNYVIRTELRGDIMGVAYLVFDEQEAQQLANIQAWGRVQEEMKEALLMEVGNILTAAVITQFANILQRNMHGHVPELSLLPSSALGALIGLGHSAEFNAISFKAVFRSESVDVKPEFVWFMEKKFFGAINDLVSGEKKSELVRSLGGAA